MATKRISELTLAEAGNLDDTILLEVVDATGASRRMTGAQLRTQQGDTALTGDVTGSGESSIATTIADGVVTLAKMANMATARLLGRSTASSGVPELISIGSGLTLSGGILTASAPAGAAPSATLLTHRALGGL